MNVVMTSFTGRCLGHWLPLAEHIRQAGGRCDFVLFPRLSDPDHAGLMALEHVLLRMPIDEQFAFIDTDEDRALREVARYLGDGYDAVLMTSCIAGPELKIKSALASSGTRIVGLQHGMFQLWERYDSCFAVSFDYFGVFGTAFVSRFGGAWRNRVLPLSLPHLDELQPVSDLSGPILIVLQSAVDLGAIANLARGLKADGQDVLLRPHPEHHGTYDTLKAEFSFTGRAEPFSDLLQRIRPAAIVTSGSTAALEALECGIPTSVLPAQQGEVYTDFGIVAADVSAGAVADVLARFDDPEFNGTLRRCMDRHTGIRGHRTQHALGTLEAMCANPS